MSDLMPYANTEFECPDCENGWVWDPRVEGNFSPCPTCETEAAMAADQWRRVRGER